MAVTANQLINRADGCKKSYKVAASKHIYQGTLTYIDSSGYLTDVTGSGANEFAGVAIAECDNSSGSNGDLECEVWYHGEFTLPGTSLAQTNVGDKIYGVDNEAVSLTASGNSFIGRLARYNSSTSGDVQLHDYLDPQDMTVTNLADDTELYFGDGTDAGLQWATGDASNHAFVIFIGDTSQQIHITDKGARDTDWNLSAGTHPTLYVHSNTTPATDFISIGAHDGTTAYVNVGGGTTLETQIAGTTVQIMTAGGVQDRGVAAVTATTGGGTTGLIPAGAKNVTVTSDSADKQISLPAAAVGDEIRILVGATGCELISAVAAHKVNDVTVGATNEAALTATNLYVCRYVAANTWVVVGYTKLGAVQSALVPDSL